MNHGLRGQKTITVRAEPSATEVAFLRDLGLFVRQPERILICIHDSCGYAIVDWKKVSGLA